MADNKEIICCPACGKEMQKVPMSTNGIMLDVCLDGCGSVYFDNRELKKFDEKVEDISDLEKALEGKNFKEVYESDVRICPVCNMNMVKNFSGATKTVQIDECYGCGGKFLDHMEIVRIRNEYETEKDRADAAIAELKSKAGIELAEIEQRYKDLDKSWAIGPRIIRAIYNK